MSYTFARRLSHGGHHILDKVVPRSAVSGPVAVDDVVAKTVALRATHTGADANEGHHGEAEAQLKCDDEVDGGELELVRWYSLPEKLTWPPTYRYM